MEVINSKDILDELIKKFANNQMIPIIGSGFTLNCNANHGLVPSGSAYKKNMLDTFCKNQGISEEERTILERKSFSEIAEYYIKYVDDEIKQRYFLNNFSEVKIDNKEKLNFLKIIWPYIYTLNIDDGIEKNSGFSHVIKMIISIIKMLCIRYFQKCCPLLKS